MELRQYARLLVSYWLLLAVFSVGGVLIAVGLTLAQPNSYESTAILSASGVSRGKNPEVAYQRELLSQGRVQTFAALAGQSAVLDAAAAGLDDATADELASSLSTDVPENTTLIRIKVKADDADSARLRADAVASALSETLQRTGTTSAPLVVVQAATLPSKPASDGASLNALLGGFLGLMAGIATASMYHYFRGHVRDGLDLAAVLTVPVIGPVRPRADHGRKGRMGLRDLATLVLSRHGDRCGPIVLIGVDRHVGAAGLTIQLARVLAGSTLRVIVISDHAQVPTDAATFLDNVTLGRTPEPHPPGRAPRGHIVEMRSGLTAADAPPLQVTRARQALAALRHQADVVLVDSPPLADGIDGAVLAGPVGSTFLVVRAGKTRRNAVSEAMQRLQTASADLEAIIVTARGR